MPGPRAEAIVLLLFKWSCSLLVWLSEWEVFYKVYYLETTDFACLKDMLVAVGLYCVHVGLSDT